MAEQGSYPLNGRTLQNVDTLTGVVTGQTADIPLSVLQSFINNGGPASGPTNNRPIPTNVGQFYFDTTWGFGIWYSQIVPAIWVNAAGVAS
jgi:hypothetical protein